MKRQGGDCCRWIDCWNKIKGKLVKKKYLTEHFRWCMIAKVIKVNEILRQALLYDFYGELLTEHQKEIYRQYVMEDLSLSEIAKEAGISRQGVHDLIKRCDQALAGYEEKLHLVERFMSIQKKVKRIDDLLTGYEEGTAEKVFLEVRKLSGEIIEEL